jgi:hypothetical protein
VEPEPGPEPEPATFTPRQILEANVRRRIADAKDDLISVDVATAAVLTDMAVFDAREALGEGIVVIGNVTYSFNLRST